MVKEFQRFHILLVTLVLLLDRVLAILFKPLIGDVWSYRLAGTVLLVSAVLLVHFADNIGLGLLRWQPLRAFLLRIRHTEDPEGRFAFAMIDTASEALIGYLILKTNFEHGGYSANANLYSISHVYAGELSIDLVTLREKRDGHGYDRIFMSCSALYNSQPDMPYSGIMEVGLSEPSGELFLNGFLNYDKVASPIMLRGKKMTVVRDEPHTKDQEEAEIESLLKSMNPNLYAASHEEFLTQHSTRPADLHTTSSAVRVACESQAYANAWKAYMAGCEGHGKRNQLFAAISQYAANDKRLVDRTGDELFTVLDLGCGNGIGGFAMAQGCGPISHYIGVDCNKWLLDNIDWQHGSTKVTKIAADLKVDAGLELLNVHAKSVDVVLAVRLLNHFDVEEAIRIIEFCHKKHRDALLLIVNPTYKLKVNADDDGSRGVDLREVLQCEPEQLAFQGVKYDHYARTAASYRKAALLCGYNHSEIETINLSGLPGEASHFILSATVD